MSRNKRTIELFTKVPIWKALLKFSLPAMIMMLVIGLYSFTDSILSINLADHHYKAVPPSGDSRVAISGADQVRLYMSAAAPINTFILAFSLLFSAGIGSRYSINKGAKRYDKMQSVVRTGLTIGLTMAVILIPVLLLIAKIWIASQYDQLSISQNITDNAFSFVWILIIGFPIFLFNQVVTVLFRAEGRNKEMMIAQMSPILLNLLLDYILMGPLNLGIQGGAIATLSSYVVSFVIGILFIIKGDNKYLKFKFMFGLKGFSFVSLIAIVLVGVAPFMRNMAQSITQTAEFNQIQHVSADVYGSDSKALLSTILSGVFPIFALFFPMIFGFVQGGRAIIGYNYGAKNLTRVKETVLWIFIYSFVTGVIIYLISAYLLINPLLHALQVKNITINVPNQGALTIPIMYKAERVYRIMMLSLPIFSVAITGMAMFSSTDRLLLSSISSMLRGLILLFPFLYGFSALAGSHHGVPFENLIGKHSIFSIEYLFWWFYPALGLATTLIISLFIWYTMKKLDKKHITLEEELEKISVWMKKFKKKKPN